MAGLASRIKRLEKQVAELATAQHKARCRRCGELDLEKGGGPCWPRTMLPRDDGTYWWFCDVCVSWYHGTLTEQGEDKPLLATNTKRIACPLFGRTRGETETGG